MYPHERSLVKQLADKPFALIGVNSDQDLEEIRKIVKDKNLTWRSFQNEGTDEKISDKWRIRGWPTIFILDGEGKIRFKGHGGDFDSVIEECLAEMGHETEILDHKEYEKKMKAQEEESPEEDKEEGDATP